MRSVLKTRRLIRRLKSLTLSPVTIWNRSGSILVMTSIKVFSRKSVRYMKAGILVANLMSFSWISLRLDLYSFSSVVSSRFSDAVSLLSLPLVFSSLTLSLLLMMVSITLSPSALQPSMRSTASMASALASTRRSVSLSTFTSAADSHFRASSVADVPAIAMSRIAPASICIMFAPS